MGFDLRGQSVVSSILAFNGNRLGLAVIISETIYIIRFALVHKVFATCVGTAAHSRRPFYFYEEE